MKCNGVQGTSGLPSAEIDELFVKQVRDCSDHIKLVEDHLKSIINKYEAGGEDQQEKI